MHRLLATRRKNLHIDITHLVHKILCTKMAFPCEFRHFGPE
jgi:hypothetical protein